MVPMAPFVKRIATASWSSTCGVQGRGHEREHVLAAQVGQPQRDAQQVRQLGLAVAAAAGLGPGPGVGLGTSLGVGARVVAGLGQQLAGDRVHVQRDVLDVADPPSSCIIRCAWMTIGR